MYKAGFPHKMVNCYLQDLSHNSSLPKALSDLSSVKDSSPAVTHQHSHHLLCCSDLSQHYTEYTWEVVASGYAIFTRHTPTAEGEKSQNQLFPWKEVELQSAQFSLGSEKKWEKPLCDLIRGQQSVFTPAAPAVLPVAICS